MHFGRENSILLLTFPPHCSHRLQPLDVGVYSSFKNYYNQQCSNRIAVEKPGVLLTIYNVAEMVGKAFPLAFTPSNITSGFSATGIYLLNTNKFTDADFLCASVTDRPLEEESECNEAEQSISHPDQLPSQSQILPSTPRPNVVEPQSCTSRHVDGPHPSFYI